MKKFYGRNRQYEEDLELEDLDAAFEEEYYEEDVYNGDESLEEESYYEGEDEPEFLEAEAEYEGEEFCEEAETEYEGEEFCEEAEAMEETAEIYEEGETIAEFFQEEGAPFNEEDVFGEENGEIDYIELEDLSEEDGVYFEEDETAYEEEDGEEDILAWSDMPDKNIFQKIWYSMLHMSTMDRIITTTGVLVLILALAAGIAFAGTRTGSREVASLDTVGAQLDGITLIGEHGLTAVADAELAKRQAAGAIEMEENGEYEENEYTREVEVVLNMTSIEKDLKLKFVNKNTNKLIANVPFSVTVTTPDGKTETWTDDDMDGIIYKSGITPGDYSVAMNALTDSKYAGYTISTKAVKVNVVKEIQYKKVDVSDEIKNESELTQKEDAENELEIESELEDTVAWVESTVTPGKVTWTEVAKSSVDLGFTLTTASVGGTTMKMAAEIPAQLLAANVSAEPEINTIAGMDMPTPSPAPTTTPVESPSPEPAESPSAAPAESSTPTPADSPDPTPEETPKTTVTGVTLEKTTLSLAVGGTAQLKATVVPEDAADKTVKWESSNPEVATVDKDGLVTAKKVGTATITVKVHANEELKATCTVTVTELGITLTPTALNILTGGSGTATAVITADKGKVTAEPGAANIATVTVGTPTTADGKMTVKITVSGVAAGTTTITVTYKDGDLEKSEKLTVTVLAKDKKLTDKSGNQLWKKVGEDKYEEATYADYINNDIKSFYLRTESEPRYTGWQSIGGKVYYFDANGNKVTGEQVIQGAKYNFASDGSLVVGSGSFGIDVSKWNGKIDWNAVKNSGVSYVIIRCGYRGYGSGALVVDPYFEQNIKGATAAGLKVGVYFFSQAVNKAEAVEEASMVLQLVKGYTISYPIFLDVEYSGAAGNTGRADSLSVAARTEIIVAFCETIRNSGYTAGVYANKSWLTGMIDTSQLSKYKIWLAQYAAAPTYTGRYDMWQYKSTGRVTGINGDVDLNLSYLGY
ncbi:MAG: Ig-like domain-containing protein [Lachnospiraceae bacterium]|nr:Ig-like domain-containing protein [Lachnospiraceae bacterium]